VQPDMHFLRYFAIFASGSFWTESVGLYFARSGFLMLCRGQTAGGSRCILESWVTQSGFGGEKKRPGRKVTTSMNSSSSIVRLLAVEKVTVLRRQASAARPARAGSEPSVGAEPL
jgi:hypothetical protein